MTFTEDYLFILLEKHQMFLKCAKATSRKVRLFYFLLTNKYIKEFYNKNIIFL